jgi:hypothetical protein
MSEPPKFNLLSADAKKANEPSVLTIAPFSLAGELISFPKLTGLDHLVQSSGSSLFDVYKSCLPNPGCPLELKYKVLPSG